MSQKLTEVKAALYDSISECDFFSILLYDRQGTVRDLNDYTATLFGKAREEIIGSSIHEYFPDDEYQAYEKNMQRLFSGELDSLKFRRRFFRADGVTAYGAGLARLLKVDGYEPSVLTIFKDVTSTVEDQNKILEKNTVLKMVIENAELLTFKYLPQTKTMVNDAVTVSTLGLNKIYTNMPDSFIQAHVADQFADAFREAFAKIDAGEEMCSVEATEKSGRIWFRQTMRVARRDTQGNPVNVIGIVEDITALKKEQAEREAAEEQTRIATEFTQMILDNTQAVLILLDKERRLLFSSPGGFERPEGFAKLQNGMDVREVYDKIFFGLLDAAEVDRISDGVQTTLDTGEKYHQKFTIGYRGNVIHIDLKATPAMYKGEMSGVLLTMNNVTDLELAREEAESSNKAKSAFLANMSHEIRTPMNAIIGISEVALNRDISKETQNDLQTIQNAGAGLLSIINDILDFSKVESGKFEIIPVDYSLPSLLMDVSNMISTKLTSKPVHLFMNLDPSIPFNLVGDDIRIKQILMNLLGNAVKFTSEGYIELRVEGEYLDHNSYKLIFKVIDTGMGIKQEDLGRLFGTFSQVDTRKNRSITGSGLGLAISKSFAKMMGGDVQVESTYGKGTTFTVTIQQWVKNHDRIGEVKQKDAIRVLLLEQDNEVIDSISRNLNSMEVSYEICRDFGHVRSYEGMTHVILKRGNLEKLKDKLEFMFERENILLWMENDEIPSDQFMDYKQLQLPLIALQLLNVFNGDDIVRSMKRKSFDSSQIIPLTFAKVLIVDDNLTNLQVAKGLMAPYKMHVDTAISGFRAIELVKKEKYDLVFMDHMMPEMDGIETVQHIRELHGEYYQKLPIVALTANAMSDAREQFVESGMDDFLSKPIEVRELNRVLKKYVQSKAPTGYLEKMLADKEAAAKAAEKKKAGTVGAGAVPGAGANMVGTAAAAGTFGTGAVSGSGVNTVGTAGGPGGVGAVPMFGANMAGTNMAGAAGMAGMPGTDALGAFMTQNNMLLQQNMLLLQQNMLFLQQMFGAAAANPMIMPVAGQNTPAQGNVPGVPMTMPVSGQNAPVQGNGPAFGYQNMGTPAGGDQYNNSGFMAGSVASSSDFAASDYSDAKADISASAGMMSGGFASGDADMGDAAADDTAAGLGDPIPGVDMASAVEKLGGSVEIYHEILATYSDDIRVQEQEIRRMYEEKDIKDFTITVHAVKSASRSIGADDLGELAFSLEKHGKAEDWSAIEAEYEPFMKALNQMVEDTAAYVKAYIHTTEDTPSEELPVQEGFDPADVEALKSACAEMDYMTAEEILQKMDANAYPEHEEDLLKTMLKCCEDFDYDSLEAIAEGL